MAKNYVIIGGGTTAVNAAQAIRANDKLGTIKIYSQERSLPYNRVNLSKELFSDLSSPKHLLKPTQWYEDNRITIKTSTKMNKIDPNKRLVLTEKGEKIPYDELLLAVGAKNRTLTVPGSEKDGVFNIREMEDAQECKAFVTNKDHILIVGGGIQGLETAWSFWQQGKKITIVEAAERLMLRQLDEEASALVKAKLVEKGITVYLSTTLQEVLGEGEVTGVVLDDGEHIACDAIFYSIGILPNLELATDASLKTNRGILVDAKMSTSQANIYAAGDVAEFEGRVEGLWSSAGEQGKTAGLNMVGIESIYNRVLPVTVFRAFDLDLFAIGQLDETDCDSVLTENEGTPSYTRILIKDNKLVGALSLRGVAQLGPYLTAIRKELTLGELDPHKMTIGQLIEKVVQINAK